MGEATYLGENRLQATRESAIASSALYLINIFSSLYSLKVRKIGIPINLEIIRYILLTIEKQ